MCDFRINLRKWKAGICPKDRECVETHYVILTLNPDVSPRMRGVVEKCNFCFHRLQAARTKAANEGRNEIDPGDYVPACVEACPTQAMTFGNLLDESSEVARLAKDKNSFRLLENLGTGPKVYYLSERDWVRKLAEGDLTIKENANG